MHNDPILGGSVYLLPEAEIKHEEFHIRGDSRGTWKVKCIILD